MRPPTVSIALPCRNAAATLDEALDSLVAQSCSDFEIVVVDDGSTDRTAAILAEWVSRDDRIKAITVPPSGIVSALQTAAETAIGRLLARMDADDVAARDRLERQVAFLDHHPNLAACGTGVRYIPPHRVRDGARRYEEWINSVVTPEEIERDLYVECPIPHPTLLIRREAFDEVGGYRHTEWPEDYDLILRLSQAGHRLGKLPDVLLQWREGPDRLSRTDVRYGDDAFRRCKVHYLSHRIRDRPVVIWGAGPVGKAFALALKRKDHVISAFVDVDPRKIGQEIHGTPVSPACDALQLRDTYALAAVGSAEGRAAIRDEWRRAGLHEPDDCCAVA